jgi:hypothetical protein
MNKAFELLKNMTKKSLHPMLLNCYHHLHLVIIIKLDLDL